MKKDFNILYKDSSDIGGLKINYFIFKWNDKTYEGGFSIIPLKDNNLFLIQTETNFLKDLFINNIKEFEFYKEFECEIKKLVNL